MNLSELKNKIVESSLPRKDVEFYLSYIKDELRDCFDSEGEMIESKSTKVFDLIDHYCTELNSELVQQNLYRHKLVSEGIEYLGQKCSYVSLSNISKHARETQIKSLKEMINFKDNARHTTRSTQLEDSFLEVALLEERFSNLTTKQKQKALELFDNEKFEEFLESKD